MDLKSQAIKGSEYSAIKDSNGASGGVKNDKIHGYCNTPYQGSYRSKGFLITDDHITCNICQNCWLKEVATKFMPLTSTQAFGTFGQGILDMTFNLMINTTNKKISLPFFAKIAGRSFISAPLSCSLQVSKV